MAPDLIVECPDCRRRYKVRDPSRRKQFRCKGEGCDTMIVINATSPPNIAPKTRHTSPVSTSVEASHESPRVKLPEAEAIPEGCSGSVGETEILQFMRQNAQLFGEAVRIEALLEKIENNEAKLLRLSGGLKTLQEAKDEDDVLKRSVRRDEKAHKQATIAVGNYAEQLGAAAFAARLKGSIEDRPLFQERFTLHEEIEDLQAEHSSISLDASASLVDKGKAKSKQVLLLAQRKMKERKASACNEAIGRALLMESSESSVSCDETASVLDAVANSRAKVVAASRALDQSKATLTDHRERCSKELELDESVLRDGFEKEIQRRKTAITKSERALQQARWRLLSLAADKKDVLPSELKLVIDDIAKGASVGLGSAATGRSSGSDFGGLLLTATVFGTASGIAWLVWGTYTLWVYQTKFSASPYGRDDLMERLIPQTGSQVLWLLSATPFFLVASGLGAAARHFWNLAANERGGRIAPADILSSWTAAVSVWMNSREAAQDADSQPGSIAQTAHRLIPDQVREKLAAMSFMQTMGSLLGVYAFAVLATWLVQGPSAASESAALGLLAIILPPFLLRAAVGVLNRLLPASGLELGREQAAQITLLFILLQIPAGIVAGVFAIAFGTTFAMICSVPVGYLLLAYVISWKMQTGFLEGAIVSAITALLAALLGGIVGVAISVGLGIS